MIMFVICPLQSLQRSYDLALLNVVSPLLLQSYGYDDLSSGANDLIRARHAAVSDGSKDIGKLLSATNRALKVSKSALAWRTYVDFIQELVIEGLASSIIKTLEHLTNQARCGRPLPPSPFLPNIVSCSIIYHGMAQVGAS